MVIDINDIHTYVKLQRHFTGEKVVISVGNEENPDDGEAIFILKKEQAETLLSNMIDMLEDEIDEAN